MGKRIRIVSTKEVVQPAESTNQGQNISSNTSDEGSDPSAESTNQGAKKRVRGPTKKKEIWELPSDEKILVTFNELCQPIGDEGNELTNFLGTLVRMPQHVGIHYTEWRKVPKEKKDDLWSIVKEKFSFESDHLEKNIKDWIINDMSNKWRCWKYELKKSSYDPTMTIDDIVASQTDDRVEAGQFRTLVESWFTEEKQVQSERRKLNRLKSIEPHVTGTKSFARVKDEETQKNKGVSPSRGGMYCITRTRKNGSIVNAIAAQVVADIKAIDQEKIDNSDWTNDDLSRVKGPERRGSVRCTGKFLARNDKRSHDQVPLLKAKVNYLQQGFMMLATAVQEQVPNLNLSSVMEFMNMEVDDLSSIHDNTIGKNPSSTSGTSHQNSHLSVNDNHSGKSDASHHHTSTSVLPVKESNIQKSSLKKPGGSRHQSSVSTSEKSGVNHHTLGNKAADCGALNKSGTIRSTTSGNKSVVRDTPNNSTTSRLTTSGNKSADRGALKKSGNKSVVRDTPNNSSTSRFNTSVAIGKKKAILACLKAF